ncbi:uncharacterized protein LOC129269419 isoform X1 [Lytechinus pictus]|uniref:uncharacterized protein LOC129269419 isoform X1 n=2 Tax=Lytechinus pictus TaxID=7653 RepID=UPI0030BA1918
MDQEVKVRLKRGKTDSEKKAIRRERNKRYGQKTFQVPVELTKELRRIGEVEGLSSDRDVLSHLVSMYKVQEEQSRNSEENLDVSTPRHKEVGTPLSAKSIPFFNSPLVPRMEKRTQRIPDSQSDRSGTSISGIEEMSVSDMEPIAELESPQNQDRPKVLDEMTDQESMQNHEQSENYFEAIEEGDFIYPLDTESDEEDVELWHPTYYQERAIAKTLPRMDVEEEVFGIESEAEEEEERETRSVSGLHKTLMTGEEAEKSRLFIASEGALKVLAKEARKMCKVCEEPNQVTVNPSGTSGHIEWTCSNGHNDRFCIQETINRTHVGDVKLATSIFVSGNNYLKVRHMLEVMGLHPISSRLFHSMQSHYVCPEVEDSFNKYLTEKANELKEKDVVVCGDARNDSPGFSAQYCTYTLLDEESKDIVHVEFMDKREAGDKSPNMEPLALERALEAVKAKGVSLSELVTDAHSTIAGMIKRDYPELRHSWDIWHGAKNLGKKLTKAASTAKTKPLRYWVKRLVNHFWHCAETCEGKVDLFYSKWRGIVHHVCNKHEWLLTEGLGGEPRCEHGDIEEREEWLLPGSPPHKALVRLVMDKKFLNTLVKFVNFRHTGELEVLHNHILMYCSKRYSFGYAAYRARNLLAMIDYQEHKDRPLAVKENGDPKLRAKWSKHAGDWVTTKVRTAKKYTYMPGMVSRILERRCRDDQPLHRPAVMLPNDPRQIRKSLAPLPRPPMENLLEKKKSRFN